MRFLEVGWCQVHLISVLRNFGLARNGSTPDYLRRDFTKSYPPVPESPRRQRHLCATITRSRRKYPRIVVIFSTWKQGSPPPIAKYTSFEYGPAILLWHQRNKSLNPVVSTSTWPTTKIISSPVSTSTARFPTCHSHIPTILCGRESEIQGHGAHRAKNDLKL
jgi:hypothetical protein